MSDDEKIQDLKNVNNYNYEVKLKDDEIKKTKKIIDMLECNFCDPYILLEAITHQSHPG
jgi:hypothetical protein